MFPQETAEIGKQLYETGVRSLIVVMITGTISGFVGAVQAFYQLKAISAQGMMGGFVAVLVLKELAPMLTAFVMAARVGTGFAAELGTMKVTEQIDALKVLAVDPIHFLVTPRLIAGLIALPLLFLIVFFLAIGGGFLVGVYLVGIGQSMYFSQSFRFVTFKDLTVGLLKIITFTIIIIQVACLEGFRATGGAEGVGRASTAAVVFSFFLIILANLVLTAVFYFI
ncbi:MAG: ABC transporter permease [Candidatus Omnitrophica bacterium]|nr:ABC transporter permease [Candidatus Omnitrophota bacterium]